MLMRKFRIFDPSTSMELLGIYAKSRHGALKYANKVIGLWFYMVVEVK